MKTRGPFEAQTDVVERVGDAERRAGAVRQAAFRHLERDLDFASRLVERSKRMGDERIRLATVGEARHTLERVEVALPGYRLTPDQRALIQARLELLISQMQDGSPLLPPLRPPRRTA